jgi:Ankyrin repeat
MNKTLQAMIKQGININLGTKGGRETALHKACRTNRKLTCIYLLKNGANPALLNGDKQRAADLASDPDVRHLVENFEEFMSTYSGEQKKVRVSVFDTKGSPGLIKQNAWEDGAIGTPGSPMQYRSPSLGSTPSAATPRSM